MSELSAVRVVSTEREGPGVTAEGTVKIGPLSTRDTVQVTLWEPPWRLTVQHMGWVKGWGSMRNEPENGSTRFWWTETLKPPWGIAGAAGMALFRPVLSNTFEHDALMLKQLVERDHQPPG